MQWRGVSKGGHIALQATQRQSRSLRTKLTDDKRCISGFFGIPPRPDEEMSRKQLQRRVYRQLGLGEALKCELVPAFECLDVKIQLLDSQGVHLWPMAKGKTTKYKEYILYKPLKDKLVEASCRGQLEYLNRNLGVRSVTKGLARQRQGKPPITVR